MSSRSKIAIIHQLGSFSDPFSRLRLSDEYYRGALVCLRDHPEWDILGAGLPLAPVQTFRRLEDLWKNPIAGVILVEGRDRIAAAECRDRGIPVVATNWYEDDEPIPAVFQDDQAIGRLAAEHFARRGFRSLAFCGPDYLSLSQESRGAPPLTAWVQERLAGFVEGARRVGADCAVFAGPAVDGARSPAGAFMRRYRRDLRQWLRGLPRPTGILVCADVWAMDCLEICREDGLRVPQDVAVIGVDNDIFRCEACRPSLTSVERNMFRVGYETAALLVRFLTTGSWGALPVLVPPLGVVERLSTDVLAVSDPKLAKALQFVRRRFREPISTSVVARNVGVSESWLRREFQRQLRFSLSSEIHRLRVQDACELLSTTILPLKTIAEAVGFGSENYLCNVFARDLGVSPSKWRASSHPRTARGAG